jgi:hypothetical protein
MHVSAFDGLTGQHLLTLPRRVPSKRDPVYNSGQSGQLAVGPPDRISGDTSLELP